MCARHGQQLGGESPLCARQQEALAKGGLSAARRNHFSQKLRDCKRSLLEAAKRQGR